MSSAQASSDRSPTPIGPSADFVVSEDFRVVQFTPPGSECSIIIGKGITSDCSKRSRRRLPDAEED